MSTLDNSADKVRSLKEHAARILAHTPSEPPPLHGGGGGGISDVMEARVTKLETHMEYVRRDLDSLLTSVSSMDRKLDALPTKKDLESWRWQWLATGIAIVALTVGGITGGLSLIQRTAPPVAISAPTPAAPTPPALTTPQTPARP